MTSNGLFRPILLIGGVAAGIWTWDGGQVVVDTWAQLPAQADSAIATEAQDVRRYLSREGDTAVTEPMTPAAEDSDEGA